MRTLAAVVLCAWVLWQQSGVNSQVYEPVWTYATMKACEQGIATHVMPRGYVRTICLPDTVDPRPPKR